VVVLIYAITGLLAVASVLMAGGSGPIYAFIAIVVASGVGLLLVTFRGADAALEATTYEDAAGEALPPDEGRDDTD
jgi:hypothetical protein